MPVITYLLYFLKSALAEKNWIQLHLSNKYEKKMLNEIKFCRYFSEKKKSIFTSEVSFSWSGVKQFSFVPTRTFRFESLQKKLPLMVLISNININSSERCIGWLSLSCHVRDVTMTKRFTRVMEFFTKSFTESLRISYFSTF